MVTALVAACAGWVGAGCSSGPQISPVTVRYMGPVGASPVPAEAVEMIQKVDARPRTPIGELEARTDGSSYDALVRRIRERAARLGADALLDVHPVWDVGAGGMQYSSDQPGIDPETEAAKAGLTLLMSRPKWVAVRGTAVRFPERHLAEKTFRLHDGSDSRPSPTLAIQQVGLQPSKPSGPQQSTPVEKP